KMRISHSFLMTYFGHVLVVLMLIVLLGKIYKDGVSEYSNTLPRSPIFYLSVLAGYLLLPLSELLIFRRLWGIGSGGLAVLLRKRVANELLLGYSGEAYLYAWARSRKAKIGTAFQAVKDVSITSALTGNLMTLLLLGLIWPFADHVGVGRFAWPALGSALIIFILSMAPLLLKGRVFSLPAAELRWIASIHGTRLIIASILTGLAWWSGIPGASALYCLLLVTVRMLIGRLPFIPNKELLFATVAVFVVGSAQPVARVASLIALLILALDGLILLALTFHDVVKKIRDLATSGHPSEIYL